MGCCGSGVPDTILPDPVNGTANKFKLIRDGILSKHYSVRNELDQKWLFIRNESSFWDKKSEFDLENYVRDPSTKRGQLIASCKIEGTEPEFSKIKESVEDSDGPFQLFDSDGDDDTEYKVSMKWKLSRNAKFRNKDDQEIATLKIKMKGRSKAELEIKRDEQGNQWRNLTSKTKLKLVEYTLKYNGQQVHIQYENKNWEKGDRSWDCDKFNVFYDEKVGRDEAIVQTKEGADTGVTLLLAFATGYFFHPKYLAEKMDQHARNAANNLGLRA